MTQNRWLFVVTNEWQRERTASILSLCACECAFNTEYFISETQLEEIMNMIILLLQVRNDDRPQREILISISHLYIRV